MTLNMEALSKVQGHGTAQESPLFRSLTQLSLASTCAMTSSASDSDETEAPSMEGVFQAEVLAYVKNTFLEFRGDALPIEEAGLHLRRVRSAPGSIAMCSVNKPVASPVLTAPPMAAVTDPAITPPPQQRDLHQRRPRRQQLHAQPQPPQVQQPQLGSPEMPTVGSAGHALKKCRPCVFLWKESGCSNGTACTFCHLCGPGEHKQRRKELQSVRRREKETRALRRSAEVGSGAPSTSEEPSVDGVGGRTKAARGGGAGMPCAASAPHPGRIEEETA